MLCTREFFGGTAYQNVISISYFFTCYFVVFVAYIPDCSEMKSFHGAQDVPHILVQCLRGY